VHELALDDFSSELDPADKQLVRVDTDRVTAGQTRAVVVMVAGEIDSSARDQFRAGLVAGCDELRSGEIFVIDLTKVGFFGSTGLQALVDVAEAMRQRRERLRHRGRSHSPGDPPAEVTGLHEMLALFDTVEQALQSTSLNPSPAAVLRICS
jgi:anti-sigma B factor antagonist